MTETLTFSAAFLIGLLGSTHCVGMCGGIMGALSCAVPAEQRNNTKLFSLLLCYNIGRIFSYTLAGAIIGSSSWFLAGQFPAIGTGLRIIASLMLIAMGLYLANWWSILRHLEHAGHRLWKHIQPKISALMPVSTIWKALAVGMLWGWIPCGLVYSALTWAATASDWQHSALIMLSFGLGTLPAVLATGIFLEGFKKLIQKKSVRVSAGVLIILFGIWTLPLHSDHTEHSNHGSDMDTDHSMHSNMTDQPMASDPQPHDHQAMLKAQREEQQRAEKTQ